MFPFQKWKEGRARTPWVERARRQSERGGRRSGREGLRRKGRGSGRGRRVRDVCGVNQNRPAETEGSEPKR